MLAAARPDPKKTAIAAEQPATMSHASYDAEDRAKFGITDGLIRLSIGLESLEDLKDDLEQAIA